MFIEALKAFLIGIVEGITEWLPISSTGHMILVDEFVKLQVSPEFLALFLVVIQLGAIMAVVILYFNKLNPFSFKKTPEQRKSTWRLWGMVVIGSIPAAVVGVLLDDWMEENVMTASYAAFVVAAMLVLYGVIFIVLERRNSRLLADAKAGLGLRGRHARVNVGDADEAAERAVFDICDVDEIDWKTALKIGAFQALAVIPGTSRSGAIIIGGMLCKCNRVAAAEFAFFLAIPIMAGWGAIKCLKFFLAGLAMTTTEIVVLAVGIVTAFVMSVIAIKFLLSYIKKNDFAVFGWYRIAVGVLVMAYFAAKMAGVIA